MKILPALLMLAAASSVAAPATSSVAAPAASIVAQPPPSAVYVLSYKYIEFPETGNETVEPGTPANATVVSLQPSPEGAEVFREIEYVIAGTTASETVKENGSTVRISYFAGPYTIVKKASDKTPYVLRPGSGKLDIANHFRLAYPYTRLFRPEYSKGSLLLEGRSAILYEIPEDQRATLAQKVDQAAEANPGAAQILSTELEARRLWVAADTRLPIMVETDSDIIRFKFKGPGPANVDIPADCLAVLKRRVESTRVERAKPY